jgi:RNA-splicing ligase RtcB
MIFNKPTKKVKELLDSISSLEAYNSHIELPDLHLKSKMEAPSSTAVNTGSYIIPSLASAAINDGMSIIKLPFKKKELTREIVKNLFTEINIHASKNKFDMNKYSLSVDELKSVCLNGAQAVLEKYNIPNKILHSIEMGGKMNKGLTEKDVDRLVPKALLSSKFSRAEFGLNFRGNHFLELQQVEKVINSFKNSMFDIEKDDISIMTHLGPGPFTGNLLRIYTNREKIPPIHRILYFFAKVYFHLFEKRRKDLSFYEIIKYFFNPDKYQAFDINTSLGADYYKLIQIGTNYGYAYQIGTYAAVRDAVSKVQKKFGLSCGEVELVWNVSHNSIYKDDKKQIVTRHNSVKIYKNKPTILAGSFDVNSCIGFTYNYGKNNYMNTHDHGIGSIIKRLKNEDKLTYSEQKSYRYYFERGTSNLQEIKESKISQSREIEDVAQFFDKENVFKPWFYLKPIATLKN